MKRCPQCNRGFDDELLFCLDDGNSLVDSSGEQETVVNRRFTIPAGAAEETAVFCGACGFENRANSKFCKRCGMDVTDQVPIEEESGGPAFSFDPGRVPTEPRPHIMPETVSFQPPPFQAANSTASGGGSGRLTVIALAIVAGILLSVIVVVLLSEDGQGTTNNTNTSKSNKAVTNSAKGSGLPQTFSRKYGGLINGKRLTLNLNRKGSELSGTAETTSYDTLSGTISDDGAFRANAYENGDRLTGIFTGKIYDDGSISGNWTTPEGDKARGFTAREE